MGYLKDRYGIMIPGKTPEGTCKECATEHDPCLPHNNKSLCYQYKFYDRHGRWPTWRDAMAHCTPEMQEVWQQALKEMGVDIDGGKVTKEAIEDEATRQTEGEK